MKKILTILAFTIAISPIANADDLLGDLQPDGNARDAAQDRLAATTTPARPTTLYPAALDSGRHVELKDVGLMPYATLWVPARYRMDRENALFIHGRRFATADGHSNVGGFLNAHGGGHIVAVIESHQDERGENRRRVVFYLTDAAWRPVKSLGSVQGDEVVVSESAIFARRPEKNGLQSLIGYDKKGLQVLGPQGVEFATPAPDGGWYVVMRTRQARSSRDIAYVLTGGNGRSRIIHKSRIDEPEVSEFINTAAIFVDSPPLADSVRTGRVVRLYKSGDSLGRDFVKWVAGPYDLSQKPPKHTRMTLLGRYTEYLVSEHTVTLASARKTPYRLAKDLAARIALAGEPDHPVMVTQLSDHGLAIGYVDVDHTKDGDRHPVFPLLSAGMDFVRTVFSNNGGAQSANSANDAYTIISPSDTVLVLANKAAQKDIGASAYAIRSNSVVNPSEMELFLVQHGIIR